MSSGTDRPFDVLEERGTQPKKKETKVEKLVLPSEHVVSQIPEKLPFQPCYSTPYGYTSMYRIRLTRGGLAQPISQRFEKVALKNRRRPLQVFALDRQLQTLNVR